jgi:hypothetical protein
MVSPGRTRTRDGADPVVRTVTVFLAAMDAVCLWDALNGTAAPPPRLVVGSAVCNGVNQGGLVLFWILSGLHSSF